MDEDIVSQMLRIFPLVDESSRGALEHVVRKIIETRVVNALREALVSVERERDGYKIALAKRPQLNVCSSRECGLPYFPELQEVFCPHRPQRTRDEMVAALTYTSLVANEGATERARIVAAGRAWVESKIESAFSTAQLSNFLDSIEDKCPTCGGGRRVCPVCLNDTPDGRTHSECKKGFRQLDDKAWIPCPTCVLSNEIRPDSLLIRTLHHEVDVQEAAATRSDKK